MADLFCDRVSVAEVREILEIIERNQETVFFLETKNPANYPFYIIPKENVILSITAETNKLEGKLPKIGYWHYSEISHAPDPEGRLRYVRYYKFFKKYKKHISIEPILDFDLDKFLKWILGINPEFGVSVGYDNYSCRLPEPPLTKTLQLIEQLEKHGIKVERKTLRKAWWE